MKSARIFTLLLIAVSATCTADTVSFEIGITDSMTKVQQAGSLGSLNYEPFVDIECAKDEGESFQLVLAAADKPLKNVTVSVQKPSMNGVELPVQWYREKYVITGNPSYAVEHVGLWPDVLISSGQFDVNSSQVQPLWFTVDVPKDANSGLYRGYIEISAGGQSKTITMNVRVRNFSLPRPGTLAAPFGLYAKTISNWYFGDPDYRKHMSSENIPNFVSSCSNTGFHRKKSAMSS
jgi:hypothetical protein